MQLCLWRGLFNAKITAEGRGDGGPGDKGVCAGGYTQGTGIEAISGGRREETCAREI